MRSDGNSVRDARNRPILLTGANAEDLFIGPTSGDAQSAFFTMRSWNMNAARVVSSLSEFGKDPAGQLARLGRLARIAGEQQVVLIIVAATDASQRHNLPTADTVEHWTSVATHLKDAPGVVFDLLDGPRLATAEADWDLWRNGGTLDGQQYSGMQTLVDAIRAAGAMQPVIAEGLNGSLANIGPHLLSDSNVIYGARQPLATDGRTAEEWDQAFGFLAASFPVMIIGWRLPNGTPACADLDRESATELAARFLRYLEERSISWAATDIPQSEFYYERRISFLTLSDDPLPADWSCGSPKGYGMGPLVLWTLARNPNGRQILRNVSAADANTRIAPGSLATAYGTGLAPSSARAETLPLPARLLNTGLELTDSRGVTFDVPLLAVTPSHINYLVPAEAAPGLALVRHMLPLPAGIENRFTSTVTIRPAAAALFPLGAIGVRFSAGSTTPEAFDVFRCSFSGIGGGGCFAVPVQLPPGVSVYLSLYGTGIRGRSSLAAVRARAGEVELPVLYAGPHESFVGLDQVNVFLPPSLRGSGSVDVAVSIDGEWSNPLRLVIQ
ncbi:MAG TPA: cellulase family glycosylhydrolase [Bryobacteraceae bacterium]|nr:cellulase family glycosylhydrolase [Bryobacteraceae bacterium]